VVSSRYLGLSSRADDERYTQKQVGQPTVCSWAPPSLVPGWTEQEQDLHWRGSIVGAGLTKVGFFFWLIIFDFISFLLFLCNMFCCLLLVVSGVLRRKNMDAFGEPASFYKNTPGILAIVGSGFTT
jgi:hypothetical protein